MSIAEKQCESLPTSWTLEDVRNDYRLLDSVDFPLRHFRITTPDVMENDCDRGCPIERIYPGQLARAFHRLPVVSDFLLAQRTLQDADDRTAIICNGGQRVGKLVSLLNHKLPIRRRKIVMWETFVESKSRIGRSLVRGMVNGSSISLVYSESQVNRLANYLGMDSAKFMHVPYKANHSKWSPGDIKIGDYIFSGGNSGRDYYTLFEAVRGTSIPVLISTTRREELEKFDIPENVVIMTATEPAFARLMAGSQFVVLPIEKTLVRSAANAGICNAMWHGKPVISADDLSLSEYTIEGETGYVVPAGDIEGLRNRIVHLWNRPELVEEMGQNAQALAHDQFTHELFHRRISRLAAVLATSS